MPDLKEVYRDLSTHRRLPLFNQPGWLDAVSPGNWNVALSFDKEGQVTGALPFEIKRKGPFQVISNPPLTSFLSILFFPYSSLEKEVSIRFFVRQSLMELINQLPRASYSRLVLNSKHNYYLPFQWEGYRTSPRYSYYIPCIRDHDRLKDQVKSSVRTDLSKAAKILSVSTTDNCKDFYDFYRKNYRALSLVPLDEERFAQMDYYLQSRDNRLILMARNDREEVCSALYIVYDDKIAYSLIGVTDEKYKDTAGSTLLFWRAIELSSARAESFNFDGSQLPAVEFFLSKFTGHTKQYMEIAGSSYWPIRSILRAWGKI